MENDDFEVESGSDSVVSLPKDAGLYWIHCNRCFEIYVHRSRRILLLACYHTICEKCVGTPSRSTQNGSNELVVCPLCNKTVRFRVLCNVTLANLKELLNPEPWCETTERILIFEAKQRESFKRGMYHKLFELDQIKKHCKLLEIINNKKFEKYEKLRFEREQLEREVLRYKEQEEREQSMRFQAAEKHSHNNWIINVNAFSGAERRRADDHACSYNGGRSTQRTNLNNSFIFCLKYIFNASILAVKYFLNMK